MYDWQFKFKLIIFIDILLLSSLFIVAKLISTVDFFKFSFSNFPAKYKKYLYSLFFSLLIFFLSYNFHYHIDNLKSFDCNFTIYNFFSQAAVDGFNPYNLPQNYLDRHVNPKLFTRAVIQNYADYPPALMYLYYIFYKSFGYCGLYYLFYLLFIISIVCYCFMFFNLSCFKSKISGYSFLIPFIFIIFVFNSPLFIKYNIITGSDKPLFYLFSVLFVLCSGNLFLYTLVAAVFASLKGLGLPIILIYYKNLVAENKTAIKPCVYSFVIFLFLFILSHLFFFPHGWLAYFYRSGRFGYVMHQSFYALLKRAGLYQEFISWMIISAAVLLIFYKKLRAEIISGYVIIAFAFLSTETGLERILAGVFVMLLYLDNYYLWAFNFVAAWNIDLTYHWTFNPIKMKALAGLGFIWIFLAVNLFYFLYSNVFKRIPEIQNEG
ncbi:MAG: hypothetical protein ACD_79C00134G0002 [uncultured bacterium]|nr:MAG: hypothetical protein ACD_79C00134G0002 [uncultured bacterium]